MSSYPPGAAMDPFAPYNQDSELDNSILEQAFADYTGLGPMYRSVCKYTVCGPSVGALIREWGVKEYDEPIIEWLGDEPVQVGTSKAAAPVEKQRWVYCSELYELGTWKDMKKAGQLVLALSVSSIVEGGDETTPTIEVKVDHEGDPEDLSKRFYEAADKVDEWASEIWDDTHGCETCAKHWHGDPDDWQKDDERWDCGNTPIWKQCPDCQGSGTCI